MITVGLDFETKSRVDLKACGTDIYASDPSTDILMCSFINKDNGQQWLWYAGATPPADLILALQLADEIEAHNARFDQLIYEYIAVDYGFPPLKKEKWVCTAAQCRVNALPANLDGATRAANAKHKKDPSGMALIRQLCIPNKKGEFNSSPQLLAKMGRYCMKDSIAMVNLTSQLRPLSEADKRDWQVNERINDRGILVDLELATLAQQYAEQEKVEIGKKLSKLTDGAITKATQTAKLLKVLVQEFSENPTPIQQVTSHKRAAHSRTLSSGVTIPVRSSTITAHGRNRTLLLCIEKVQKDPAAQVKYTLDKAARSQLLANPYLDPHYREVITLIDQGGNSSVSKFTSMLNRADPETGRVHGAFIFAGAGQTQRYSSKGLQLHNMRRDCFDADTTEQLKERMQDGQPLLDVMNTLARLLRPTIIPAKGHKFVVGDWSAIEARVLPWLSASRGGEGVLELFSKGVDIYVETAHSIGVEDRQIGKVANLSLGFGGAVGAFQAMAKNYGLDISDGFALTVVGKWRTVNQWAVKFWKELENAACKAVRNPETVTLAGRIKYIFIPQILGGTLMCILPNDTVIQYPYARIEKDGVTCMKASVQPKADSDDEWPRMRLWGGFLAENVTQATAACLMRELLADMVEDDFSVVGHCHDEVILEVLDSEVEQTLIEVQEYMEAVPEWATGLPLKAEPVVMARYGK